MKKIKIWSILELLIVIAIVFSAKATLSVLIGLIIYNYLRQSVSRLASLNSALSRISLISLMNIETSLEVKERSILKENINELEKNESPTNWLLSIEFVIILIAIILELLS